ncbi:MAG: hypothetical protein ACKVQA_04145 [Burkholderiales bacterium]
MIRNSVLRALAVLALAFPAMGAIHGDGEAEEDAYPAMDCEHPPSGAIKKLPEPLARWARISCFPSGQALSQAAHAQWRYPGSWTDRVFLPARTQADENDARPRYFTQFDVRELPFAEAREHHQRLLKEVAVYADRISDGTRVPDAPSAAWEIVGTNNQSNSFHLYMMQHAGKAEMWGLMCAPKCESHLSFIVTLLQ